MVSAWALDGTTAQLTPAGLAALPELAGPIPFDTGTYGYPATANPGVPSTPWLDDAEGDILAGVYQHPGTDPQAGVAELELNFDHNADQLQWLLLAPGLINWVTQDAHLGIDRNYVEMDIDDTFTPDNAWSIRGDRPVQRGGLPRDRPVPGLRDRRAAGRSPRCRRSHFDRVGIAGVAGRLPRGELPHLPGTGVRRGDRRKLDGKRHLCHAGLRHAAGQQLR